MYILVQGKNQKGTKKKIYEKLVDYISKNKYCR